MGSIAYPQPSKSALFRQYVGKTIQELPLPAAIIDQAVVKRNCEQMLAATKSLKVQFRPHVKTHKTVEAARLQIGDLADLQEVNIIVSTVAEAEMMVHLLREYKEHGKDVNILYGVPIAPSQIPRLATIEQHLGPGSISVMVDDAFQLTNLRTFRKLNGHGPRVFVKCDTGYGRAGLAPSSQEFRDLVQCILNAEEQDLCQLYGLYSHAGHSYGGNSAEDAIHHLVNEIGSMIVAADSLEPMFTDGRVRKLILSAGATPSATSIEAMVSGPEEHTGSLQEARTRLRVCVNEAQSKHIVEMHAGVYAVMDMQQLATRASPSSASSNIMHSRHLGYGDVALTILAEVVSTYMHRSPPEVLIACGSIALAREPAKSYDGWGIVSKWGIGSTSEASGWQVARISQEHGILQKRDDAAKDLKVGQKLRIFPNHACMAGASFSFYAVIDSDTKRPDEIVDVWVRCRGW